MSTSLLVQSCKIAGIKPPCFSNASSTRTSLKQKSRQAMRAGGSVPARRLQNARQGSTGAAGSRDDDGGAVAPENPYQWQSTGIQLALSIGRLRLKDARNRY